MEMKPPLTLCLMKMPIDMQQGRRAEGFVMNWDLLRGVHYEGFVMD